MNKAVFAAVVVCALGLARNAAAEPTTVRTRIAAVRPYNVTPGGSGAVYITTPTILAPCNSQLFRIDLGNPGAREMYAAALAAMLAGNEVALEIANAGCGPGPGSALQSITVVARVD